VILVAGKVFPFCGFAKSRRFVPEARKKAESETPLNSLRELQNIPSTSQPATPSNQTDPQTIIATANEAIVRNPKDANAYTRRASGRYQQGDKQKH
jgi:hypothetical protein